MSIAVIGSINTDLVTRIDRMPRAGETRAATSFAIGRGGKGANQAVAAARLGAQIAFVGRVGADAFGTEALEAFARDGIDTTHVIRDAASPSGTAVILVEVNGENRILLAPGANAELGPADIDAAREVIAAASLVVLQLEIPLASVARAIDTASVVGTPVLLNPAPACAREALARFGRVRFLVPNETELASLTALPAETDAEIETAARALLAQSAEHVIVTRGARGATHVTRDHVAHIPAQAVAARDTTGAGDAFIGAFAHAIDHGETIDDALGRALSYAAASVTRDGAQDSYPDQRAAAAIHAAAQPR